MMELLRKLIKNKNDLNDFLVNNFFVKRNLNLTYFNQNTFNIACSSNDFIDTLREFNVYQEGIGNYLALKFLGFKEIDRIDSTEVLYNIFNKFSLEKSKVFIIGDNIPDEILKNISAEKRLNLVGYYNGFYTNEEFEFIVKKIQDSNAEFVIVGMGSPKQEFAVLKFRNYLDNVNFLCVGNFLRFYFGLQKRAPKLFRIFQLEWFYRFLQEPERLFKRYFLGIPQFFYRVLLIKLKQKIMG